MKFFDGEIFYFNPYRNHDYYYFDENTKQWECVALGR